MSNQATNLTVKKYDGATDVTFSVLTASGGDSSPAIWRNEAAVATPNARPTMQLVARANASKTARRSEARFENPYFITGTDGLISVVNRGLVMLTVVSPVNVPDSHTQETVAQALHLWNTPEMIESLILGYAPV